MMNRRFGFCLLAAAGLAVAGIAILPRVTASPQFTCFEVDRGTVSLKGGYGQISICALTTPTLLDGVGVREALAAQGWHHPSRSQFEEFLRLHPGEATVIVLGSDCLTTHEDSGLGSEVVWAATSDDPYHGVRLHGAAATPMLTGTRFLVARPTNHPH